MADTLGTRISENRKKKSISQEQLAEHFGISSQAVSKWENDISCPDISLLPQLADYFNTSIDELLCGKSSDSVQLLAENERKDINKMLFKIFVNSSDGDLVKMNIPLGLIKTAIEVGMKMPQISGNKQLDVLKDIDIESILLMAESGVIGKILEVKNADGEVVEIAIE